jgi:hypothetical protein
MSQFDSTKDYYGILGAHEKMSARELEKHYRRMAARCHPDKGGSEEVMKSVNEAYGVLKDSVSRRAYDAGRRVSPVEVRPGSRSAPAAPDVGVFGRGLSAFLCLIVGLFLLFLVRFQWIWFLWPLGILAVGVIFFGVLMMRHAVVSFSDSVVRGNPFRRHKGIQELLFWLAVGCGGYGVYLLLTAV